MQSKVSTSWILVWFALMYHCCSGLLVIVCLNNMISVCHDLRICNCLHYERGTSCTCLRHDDELRVLLGCHVDFAVALWHCDLSQASCGERERSERCEQHILGCLGRCFKVSSGSTYALRMKEQKGL